MLPNHLKKSSRSTVGVLKLLILSGFFLSNPLIHLSKRILLSRFALPLRRSHRRPGYRKIAGGL